MNIWLPKCRVANKMPTGARQKNKALYPVKTLYVKHKEIFIFHNKICNPSVARNLNFYITLPNIKQ